MDQQVQAREAAGMVPLAITINGQFHRLEVHALTTLLITLREHLGLNGTKIGCGHGQCGACTVLIDGQRKLSCLTFACAADGKSVTSIEGLANGDQLHAVQEAFVRHEGFQCGYCTPGQIMSAAGLLGEGCQRNRSAVAEAMSGNICRCGAYEHIISAVLDAMGAGEGQPA